MARVKIVKIGASADDEGWADLAKIANRITNEGPFDHRTYGYQKLVDLFESIDLFEVQREKHGAHTIVCVRIAKVGGRKVKPKAPVIEIDHDDIPF